jgi:hypothetical protein
MRYLAIATVSALISVPAMATGLFDDDCRYTGPRRVATPAAGITKVVIRAEAGSLTVEGVNAPPQIVAAGTACTSDDEFLPRMTLTLRKVGSELHVESQIPDKTVLFGFFSARLDFTVTIPSNVPVEIDDDSGWIKVTNTAATSIDDDSGSIEVRQVRGPLAIQDDSGSIDVQNVTGDVTIEDDSGEIIVRNVGGNVEIEDDSGAITVSQIAGSLRVSDDDSGSIMAQHVKRDVVIDRDSSGSVDVTDIGGNFTVSHKSSGHIDYARVAGRVSIPEKRR